MIKKNVFGSKLVKKTLMGFELSAMGCFWGQPKQPYEDINLRTVGGCKEFSLHHFVFSGPEVLKITFSYRQWIDIRTYIRKNQKVNLRPKLAQEKILEFSMIGLI